MPTIELAGMKNGHFRRNIFISDESPRFEEKLASHIKTYRNTDIYYTVYRYCGEDRETCPLLAPVYLDFDDDNIEKNYMEVRREVYMAAQHLVRIWKVPEEQIRIYFSGSKGFHVIIPHQVFGIEPDPCLNEKIGKIAAFISRKCGLSRLDLRIYDRKRLFRVPYSKNGKSGLSKIPLSLGELMSSSYEEICSLAKENSERNFSFILPSLSIDSKTAYKYMFVPISKQTKKKAQNMTFEIPKKIKELMPCVTGALKDGVGKGIRNSTSVALASCLLQSGRSPENVEQMMIEWNEKNAPPLSENELVSTVASAYSMLMQGKAYGCHALKDLGFCAGQKCRLLAPDTKRKSGVKWQQKKHSTELMRKLTATTK